MIYTLMEKDSYRRFLKSKLIQDLCQQQSNAAQEKKEKRSYDMADSSQVLAGGA